jgi:integrase
MKTTAPNPENERLKREFIEHERRANGFCEPTLKSMRKSLLRFEEFTGRAAFSPLTVERAAAFQAHMRKSDLSKSTLLHTMGNVKRFFAWLSCKPGYKSKIDKNALHYFRITEKDMQIARAEKYKECATFEQFRQAILSMPHGTDIERRDRALMACALLTAARDGALISLRLRHVDIARRLVKQEGDVVRTKRSKTINSFFLPVGKDIEEIFAGYVRELREERLFGHDDPLFPRTAMRLDENGEFTPSGLSREFWKGADTARKIFRAAFENIGLPYYHPHTVRHTLARHFEGVCKSPEEFKALSPNFGHSSPLTTFQSYGTLSGARQEEVLAGIGRKDEQADKIDEIFKMLKHRQGAGAAG